jgi:biopolymer transport protein ExbD
MDRSLLVKKLVERRIREKRIFEHRPFEAISIGDIAFLLFIFFIVTSSFVLREGIFFSLPSQNAATIRLSESDIAEVEPAEQGFRYEGTLLERKAFSEEMKKFFKGNGDRVLIIAMSPSVRYDRLIDTLSVARETGIRKVSIKQLKEGRP